MQLAATGRAQGKRSEFALVPAAGRFRGFVPQKENAARTATVGTSVVSSLLEEFSSYRLSLMPTQIEYSDLLGRLWTLAARCTPKDVEAVSIGMWSFRERRFFSIEAGLFLSALINAGGHRNYVVRTDGTEPPDYLGTMNTKNVAVIGGAGKHAGYRMQAGKIIITEDADLSAGSEMSGGLLAIMGESYGQSGFHMSGGELRVRKAAHTPGSHMEGGVLRVGGESHGVVANGMKGGSIYLNDREGEPYISDNIGADARVYLNGRLIWPVSGGLKE
jgi:hypothetical protein